MVKMEGRFLNAKDHHFYMEKALIQAQKAVDSDEVPVGAVVVSPDGTIIGRGFNQVESKQSQTGHAEITAIKQASRKLDNWRLEDCTMYVTLEPCNMCMGLIGLSRLSRLIYGADSPLFGYRSLECNRRNLDNKGPAWVYKNDMVVESGVGAEKAQKLLKQFFQKKRKKKGEYQKAGTRGDKGNIDPAAE